MKILLVNPSSPGIYNSVGLKLPPLGLGYLASVLQKNHHQVKILDLQVEKKSSLDQELINCDLVGITCESNKIFKALDIATKAKQKGCITVMGGYHSTFRDKEILSLGVVDYVVKGEGEYIFSLLVQYLEENKDISGLPGVSFRKDNVIFEASIPPPPNNLDDIPYPSRELFSLGKYWMTQIEGEPLMNIVTSRGCPFACSFCASSNFAGTRWRTRSIENIMGELEQLYYDYGYRGFAFMDDNFTLQPGRIELLTEKIQKNRMNIKWWCFSRVDTIMNNVSLIKKMASAGLKMVFLGLESADPQSLKDYGKKITTEISEKAVKVLHSNGIKVLGSFILGNIHDTQETITQTIEYAKKLNLDIAQFSALTPFPGTQFFQKMIKENRIFTWDWKLFDGAHSVIIGDYLKPQEIQKMILSAYIDFYRQGKQISNVWGFIRKFVSTHTHFINCYKESYYQRRRMPLLSNKQNIVQQQRTFS